MCGWTVLSSYRDRPGHSWFCVSSVCAMPALCGVPVSSLPLFPQTLCGLPKMNVFPLPEKREEGGQGWQGMAWWHFCTFCTRGRQPVLIFLLPPKLPTYHALATYTMPLLCARCLRGTALNPASIGGGGGRWRKGESGGGGFPLSLLTFPALPTIACTALCTCTFHYFSFPCSYMSHASCLLNNALLM